MVDRPARNSYGITLKYRPHPELEREIIDGLAGLEGTILAEIVEEDGEVIVRVWDNLFAYVGGERQKNFMRETEARRALLKYPKS